jgi:hypothetical protein
VGEAAEHGEDAIARGESWCDRGVVDVAPGLSEAEGGDDLVGTAGCDAERVEAVPPVAAPALTGLAAVRAEWAFVCTTHNLLKLFRRQSAPAAV